MQMMDEVQTVYDFTYDTPSSETYNTESNSCPSVHKNLCLVCNLKVNYHRLQALPLTRWIQSIYPDLISLQASYSILSAHSRQWVNIILISLLYRARSVQCKRTSFRSTTRLCERSMGLKVTKCGQLTSCL